MKKTQNKRQRERQRKKKRMAKKKMKMRITSSKYISNPSSSPQRINSSIDVRSKFSRISSMRKCSKSCVANNSSAIKYRVIEKLSPVFRESHL